MSPKKNEDEDDIEYDIEQKIEYDMNCEYEEKEETEEVEEADDKYSEIPLMDKIPINNKKPDNSDKIVIINEKNRRTLDIVSPSEISSLIIIRVQLLENNPVHFLSNEEYEELADKSPYNIALKEIQLGRSIINIEREIGTVNGVTYIEIVNPNNCTKMMIE
jgi:hypothetical protein